MYTATDFNAPTGSTIALSSIALRVKSAPPVSVTNFRIDVALVNSTVSDLSSSSRCGGVCPSIFELSFQNVYSASALSVAQLAVGQWITFPFASYVQVAPGTNVLFDFSSSASTWDPSAFGAAYIKSTGTKFRSVKKYSNDWFGTPYPFTAATAATVATVAKPYVVAPRFGVDNVGSSFNFPVCGAPPVTQSGLCLFLAHTGSVSLCICPPSVLCFSQGHHVSLRYSLELVCKFVQW